MKVFSIAIGFAVFLFSLNTLTTPFLNKQSLVEEKPPYGGTLVWGTTNPPTIINPVLTTHSVSMPILGLVFNSLVRTNSEVEIEPDLAERWDISDNGLVYTFYLKKGVRFHNGIECTAEDVAFTYDQIMDPVNNSPFRFSFDLVEKFEAVDKYIFRVTLRQPFAPIIYSMEREIMPKHIWEHENIKTSAFNYYPIGTGPFKFKSWDKETNQIELEANKDYFEGRPYLGRIVIKTFPDNTQLWGALMRQEVDFVKYLNREDYLVLKKDPTFKTYQINWEMYCALAYNLKDSIYFDESIRTALAYAIDTEMIMKEISGGGVKSTGPFYPDSAGFNKRVKPYEYNPVKAKMELMHRGWRDIDGDGILERGGRDLELRLLVDESSEYYKKMAMIIRQQLAEIGVKVEVSLYHDENDFTEEYLKINKPQAWIRFFYGLGYDAARNWYSLSDEHAKLWNYRNKEVDRLFEQGALSSSEETRNEIYQEIHKIVYDDQPACFLFFPASFHAVSAKFKSTDEFFTASMPVYAIKDWYIEKNSDLVLGR